MNVKLTVLYDNRSMQKGIEKGWGFSCLVERGDSSILFDTGDSGAKLLANMRVMGKNPRSIQKLVLSHKHSDHVGGAAAVLSMNPNIALYIPASFPESLFEELHRWGSEPVRVKDAMEIADGVLTTGEMGVSLQEQALVIDGGEMTILLTGCAHPGVVAMARRAREIGGGKPLFIVGGIHLFDRFSFQIRRTVSQLEKIGVERIAPCHCTGRRGMRELASRFGKNYIEVSAGAIIEI